MTASHCIRFSSLTGPRRSMPRSSDCSARHVSSSLRSRRAPVRPPPLEAEESFFLEVELDLETLEDVADLSLRDEEDGIVPEAEVRACERWSGSCR